MKHSRYIPVTLLALSIVLGACSPRTGSSTVTPSPYTEPGYVELPKETREAIGRGVQDDASLTWGRSRNNRPAIVFHPGSEDAILGKWTLSGSNMELNGELNGKQVCTVENKVEAVCDFSGFKVPASAKVGAVLEVISGEKLTVRAEYRRTENGPIHVKELIPGFNPERPANP